eukprot:Hpha_TRINITY_DN16389_c1_g5::TRINITY_DN16389_c1_g5_i1::g.60055::m.60055
MRKAVSFLAVVLAASGAPTYEEVKVGECSAGTMITDIAECWAAMKEINPSGYAGREPTKEQNPFYPIGCYMTYGMGYVNEGDPPGVGKDCTDLSSCFCKMAAPGGGGGGGGGDSGCGGGCAFLIIFFVGGFVYLAAGAAFGYIKQEKRGVEMVPHLDFWKDFPYLVKDGVMFAVNKVRGGGQGYSAVV